MKTERIIKCFLTHLRQLIFRRRKKNLHLCALSVSPCILCSQPRGESVAPGQTYASFHCTNPNAAWRNNCSSGRGFAGALSLTGSRQQGTRRFNQLSLSLCVFLWINPQTFYQTGVPITHLFFCCCQLIIFGSASSLLLTVRHIGRLYWQNGRMSNDCKSSLVLGDFPRCVRLFLGCSLLFIFF